MGLSRYHAKRKGSTFIDYLRNAERSTAIAAYGVRASKNARVSPPIAWNEVAKDVRFNYFNVKTVLERLKKLRDDPRREFQPIRQTVAAAMFKQIGGEH